MTRAKLYFSRNLNPRLCVAVSRYLGADLDYVENSTLTQDQRASFGTLNPMGRFPVLQQPDGTTLWETDAIICQLSRQMGSDLWRRDDSEPQMIRWLSWTAYHLMPAGDVHYFERIVRPTFSDQPELPQIMENSMRTFANLPGCSILGWVTSNGWLAITFPMPISASPL